MESENVKISVFVPLTHCEIVRKTIGDAGGGKIGTIQIAVFLSEELANFNQMKRPTHILERQIN